MSEWKAECSICACDVVWIGNVFLLELITDTIGKGFSVDISLVIRVEVKLLIILFWPDSNNMEHHSGI